MRVIWSIPILAILALSLPAIAKAQDFPGDPAAGRRVADEVCGTCHSISGPRTPTQPEASLTEIANDPRMTGMALVAWLTATPHPTMPNVILTKEDARNVVAFMLSLQGGGHR